MSCLTKAFAVFVRPLEYCSPVCCPSYKYLVDSIESVQRRFTKYLPSSISYSERLEHLRLDNLELRRLYIDLTPVIPVSMHVSTSSQSELFLLGITYQQPSLPRRLSVYL